MLSDVIGRNAWALIDGYLSLELNLFLSQSKSEVFYLTQGID